MFDKAALSLKNAPSRWLVTGVAGFIGSNILEKLLGLGQSVVGLDNYCTGHKSNLDSVRARVGEEAWENFHMIEGDITNPSICREACEGVRYVLHQAALGSVPRSMEDPISSDRANVGGFVNMLTASKDAGVSRFVYASSSSVYGDHPVLPKVEPQIGNQLSPYAVTKRANELYAEVFGRCYGLQAIGLRYFNIFGPRQDPDGAYAAVIPKWFDALLKGNTVFINGDGETSRDFCYVGNAVRINILAAVSPHPEASGKSYNVACGARTTLNELFVLLRDLAATKNPESAKAMPVHRAERAGDVRHSLADISRAKSFLGYEPVEQIQEGLDMAAAWYFELAARNCG